MKKITSFLLAFFLCGTLLAWAESTRPQEIMKFVDSSIKQIDKHAPASYKTKYKNGSLKEEYIKKPDYVEWSLHAPDGKLKEHYVHKQGMMMLYERYYPNGKDVAELCQVDSRFIKYDKFWENGHTKEHFLYILKDKSTEYYTCDKDGKIILPEAEKK